VARSQLLQLEQLPQAVRSSTFLMITPALTLTLA